MTGKEVLLEQLRFFEGIHEMEADDKIRRLAEKLDVPKDLYGTFAAYCSDFVFEHEGCLNPDGAFWDDDILKGII